MTTNDDAAPADRSAPELHRTTVGPVPRANERPAIPVADRRATEVGAALGQATPVTGRCHYCGLLLDSAGHRDECV